MINLPVNPEKPTMYFIGVTTSESSIMEVFPRWMEALDLDYVLEGIDIDIHADPEDYRKAVSFIKNNEFAYGALVTTHKIDLFNACKDQFDYLDPHASIQEEMSCITKKEGKLKGYAKDPITSGLSMEEFIPKDFWKKHMGEVMIIGAGGSARAIGSYLFNKDKGQNMPSKLIINNRSQPRLDKFKRIFKEIDADIPVEYHLTPDPELNDNVLKKLKPYSMVVNATGLGKDRPGSPLTDECQFPENSLVWELNYRGERRFMYQALEQKKDKSLYIEDGWMYFIHGWAQHIAEVFDIEIDKRTFNIMEDVANKIKRPESL